MHTHTYTHEASPIPYVVLYSAQLTSESEKYFTTLDDGGEGS